jgi:hypothetical protein
MSIDQIIFSSRLVEPRVFCIGFGPDSGSTAYIDASIAFSTSKVLSTQFDNRRLFRHVFQILL